ncbi:hypothetical protein [Tolypothrix sp. NIES-4075]|uniref:hypothetical protein n=1 Tax=Tolypothrix sp. NIES-4075 TaxID=2005459 RepID=UPI00135A817E|nr:hypothetical protein [Tolypothrix sp. NIES-4075]
MRGTPGEWCDRSFMKVDERAIAYMQIYYGSWESAIGFSKLLIDMRIKFPRP